MDILVDYLPLVLCNLIDQYIRSCLLCYKVHSDKDKLIGKCSGLRKLNSLSTVISVDEYNKYNYRYILLSFKQMFISMPIIQYKNELNDSNLRQLLCLYYLNDDIKTTFNDESKKYSAQCKYSFKFEIGYNTQYIILKNPDTDALNLFNAYIHYCMTKK